MPATIKCLHCGTTETLERVGFRDECRQCRRPLHTCKHCKHFSVSAYNQCAEPNAERVLDKDNANKCDYFAPASATSSVGASGRSGTSGPLDKSAADALLKQMLKK